MSQRFEEIECKFLDVDPKKLAAKLRSLGAKQKFDRTFRRYVFDFPDLRLNADNSWLRVRDEGDKVTMSYKQRQGVTAKLYERAMELLDTSQPFLCVVSEDFLPGVVGLIAGSLTERFGRPSLVAANHSRRET